MDSLNKILKKENISCLSETEFMNIFDYYSDHLEEIKKINKEAFYGLTGYANKWGQLSGGAVQIYLPLNGTYLIRLGIMR